LMSPHNFVAESCATPKILILPVTETSSGRSSQTYESKKVDFEQRAKKPRRGYPYRKQQHSRHPSAQLNSCRSDTFFDRGTSSIGAARRGTTRGGEDDLRAAGFWCGRWRRYRARPFPCAGRLLRAPLRGSLSDRVPGAWSTARRLRGEIVLRPTMGPGA
jgi:hypothetical protein